MKSDWHLSGSGRKDNVSIVVATYNRGHALFHTIPTMIAQGGVAEVIVVDDHSSICDSTWLSHIARGGPRLRIHHKEQHMGSPACRNQGASLAKTEYVLFMDDDMFFSSEEVVKVMVEHAQQTSADILGGRVIFLRDGESLEGACSRVQRQTKVIDPRCVTINFGAYMVNDVSLPILPPTMLVRRTVLAQVGFSETYVGNAYREETDFQLRAHRLGYKLVYCPHVSIYHLAPSVQRRGGQHGRSKWQYYLLKYRNAITFYREHEAFLKTLPEFDLSGGFIRHILSLVWNDFRTGLLKRDGWSVEKE